MNNTKAMLLLLRLIQLHSSKKKTEKKLPQEQYYHLPTVAQTRHRKKVWKVYIYKTYKFFIFSYWQVIVCIFQF